MVKMKSFIKKHHILKKIVLMCHEKLICVSEWVFGILLPVKKNKIVICSYYGKGYGDNSKYIVEEIINQNIDCDIVWLINRNIDMSDFPNRIRCVKYGSLKSVYELATAKVWIDNSRKFVYPHKKKSQCYIQTWHGSLGIKKCEKDAESNLSEYYLKCAKNDSNMANIFLSNGKFITNLYRNSFWYNGEILQSGSPRNDILVNQDENTKKMVFEKIHIKGNKKVLLYAPTFRNSNNTEIYSLDYESCIKSLNDRFGEEWIILVRLHPNMYNEKLKVQGDNIYNVTQYPDMQELLLIADILITDYSSCMFDFALKRTPCFLYVPDEKDYINERNFYFNLDELPFKKANTNEELKEIIGNFDDENYVNLIEKFFTQQGIVETGQASKIVVDYIKNIVREKEK